MFVSRKEVFVEELIERAKNFGGGRAWHHGDGVGGEVGRDEWPS